MAESYRRCIARNITRPALRGRLALLVGLVGLCAAAACAAQDFPGAAVARALQQLAAAPAPGELAPAEQAQLERFYRARHFQPVWVGPEGGARTSALIDALSHAKSEGLRPQDYGLGAIERRRGAHSPQQLADLEWRLSAAWWRYATDLNAGRARLRKADRHWHIVRAPVEPMVVLRQALVARSFSGALKGLEPPHAAYRHLREALARYRGLAARGGWPLLPKGPSLKPGMRGPRVTLLRRRLRIEGDLGAGADSGSDRLDGALEQAVRHFQQRNGLVVDGIVGNKTRAAMNVPVAVRIAQIRVNMERWRWLPPSLGARYLMVNSAAFDLHVVEGGKTVMTMKAIIGRATRQTPSLRSAVDTVIVNPYWHVPARLARLDLLPKEQADPGYFRKLGIRVFSGKGADAVEIDPGTVDWNKLSARDFPYRLRQDPGPQNALGRIKLLFPNPYDVYLHDTPARDLFECAVRTFSSGCVRVEHALELAAYVLRGTDDWDAARLKQAVEAGATRKLRVADPIPIYLVYLTAWADADGTVHFRDDVYGRDRAMLRRGL